MRDGGGCSDPHRPMPRGTREAEAFAARAERAHEGRQVEPGELEAARGSRQSMTRRVSASDELLAGLFRTTEEKEEEEAQTESRRRSGVKEGIFELGEASALRRRLAHRGSARDPLRPGEARRRGDHRSAVCDLRLRARGSGATLQTTKCGRSSRSSSRDRRKALADRAPSTRSPTGDRGPCFGNA